MLSHILLEVEKIKPKQTIVVHSPEHRDLIKNAVTNFSRTKLVKQKHPLGTGDALKTATPNLDKENNILVLLGDVPMIKAKHLNVYRKGLRT